MDAANFFSELQKFLPVYVSPIKSYLRAALAFVVVMSLANILEKSLARKIDINGDSKESRNEERVKLYIYYASFFILGLLASDLTYTVSWRLSNRVNLIHNGYRRWFPKLYT